MTNLLINWTVQPFGDGWGHIEPDAVVWLDVARVEKSFSLDINFYVGIDGTRAGQPSRYEKIGRHIESGAAIWMPQLCLTGADEISFTDGRHRFAWVRDHGAIALPVATDPAQADQLAALFGSPLRICEIRSDWAPGQSSAHTRP
jgi:hypothetical protein